MPVVQLLVDVDSDVHPELHGTLSAIASPALQRERLRQLAATGLVWERLRLQTHALAQAMLLDALPAGGRSAAPAPGPAQAAAGGFTDVEPFMPLPAVPAADADIQLLGAATAPHGGEPADIPVLADLPADPESAALFLREMRTAVRELPVLTEVVDPAEASDADDAAMQGAVLRDAAGLDRGRPRPGLQEQPVRKPARPLSRDGAAFKDTGGVVPDVVPAEMVLADDMPPPPSKPATRSRLMRMQEKGLFKNE